MNIRNVTPIPNSGYNFNIPDNIENTPEFSIPKIGEQPAGRPAIQIGNDPDAVSVMESMTGKAAANEPSYSVTEEEAEYFKEKYGENYDEDKVCELYEELEKKGVTDPNYFTYASGYMWVMPLDGLKVRGFLGIPGYDPYNLGRYCGNGGINFTGDKVFIKDVSRTDENAYKYEWESFKKQYDREVNTWADALQESIDFEYYLKNNKNDGDYLLQQHFNNVIANLEKTKNVIFQIFG